MPVGYSQSCSPYVSLSTYAEASETGTTANIVFNQLASGKYDVEPKGFLMGDK